MSQRNQGNFLCCNGMLFSFSLLEFCRRWWKSFVSSLTKTTLHLRCQIYFPNQKLPISLHNRRFPAFRFAGPRAPIRAGGRGGCVTVRPTIFCVPRVYPGVKTDVSTRTGPNSIGSYRQGDVTCHVTPGVIYDLDACRCEEPMKWVYKMKPPFVVT